MPENLETLQASSVDALSSLTEPSTVYSPPSVETYEADQYEFDITCVEHH